MAVPSVSRALMRELRLKVELQSELKDAWIADGAGINAEVRGSESRVGDDKVRMIENVESLGPESEKVLFGKRKLFAEVHIPVLFKGAADEVAAEIAEECTAARTEGEGLIAGATVDVQVGNNRTGWQCCGDTQDAGIKYAGGAREILRTTAQH